MQNCSRCNQCFRQSQTGTGLRPRLCNPIVSLGGSMTRKVQTHCKNGHKYTPANTVIEKETGWRHCVKCRKASYKKFRNYHKEERNAYLNLWRKRNRGRVQATRRAQYERIRLIVEAAKSKPCADCGKFYHFCIMDFDHVRGTKKREVSKMNSTKSVIAEIAKCDVVCSNCHRLRTFKRQEKRLKEK